MKNDFLVRCPFCFQHLAVKKRPGFELAGVKSCPGANRGRGGRHAFHWLHLARTAAPARLNLRNVGSP